MKAAQHKTAQTHQFTSIYSAQRVNGTGANGNLHVPTARMFRGEWIFFYHKFLKTQGVQIFFFHSLQIIHFREFNINNPVIFR